MTVSLSSHFSGLDVHLYPENKPTTALVFIEGTRRTHSQMGLPEPLKEDEFRLTTFKTEADAYTLQPSKVSSIQLESVRAVTQWADRITEKLENHLSELNKNLYSTLREYATKGMIGREVYEQLSDNAMNRLPEEEQRVFMEFGQRETLKDALNCVAFNVSHLPAEESGPLTEQAARSLRELAEVAVQKVLPDSVGMTSIFYEPEEPPTETEHPFAFLAENFDLTPLPESLPIPDFLPYTEVSFDDTDETKEKESEDLVFKLPEPGEEYPILEKFYSGVQFVLHTPNGKSQQS
jgi:hypothetical protein